MAISDILARIQVDAAAEAGAITSAAQAEADRIVEQAEGTAAETRRRARERAERQAADEAATLLAGARLAARDALLAEKRTRAERVLEAAREALVTLPEHDYVELIAARVAGAARGGEHISFAPADAARLGSLVSRLGEMGVQVTPSTESAPVEHGILLVGDRVRVEISPASLVADARDELLLVASRELFGEA